VEQDFAANLRLTIVEIKDSIQYKIAQRTGKRKNREAS
jgi:hypothetical protein